MNIPAEFSDIRPYQPEELPAVFAQLLANPQFVGLTQQIFPDIPADIFRAQLLSCKDSLDFQKKFIYRIVSGILSKAATSVDFDCASLTDKTGAYTFVSNHRDIVLDSAILDLLLVDNAFRTTAEIAIGDNLLVEPWIEPVVKLNKAFLVRRNVGIREMLANSRTLSRYMHFAITEKRENIWIAQREGRAKDSDDRTQEALLKMMAMGGSGSPLESLRELNIVPLAISYEYDPCDFLKAKEFQQKRDDAAFKKTKADDYLNMKTGILGFKGRVHYAAAAPINTWLDELKELPKAEVFAAVAARMDRAIHRGYRLFAVNYVAADLLAGDAQFATRYTPQQRKAFEEYVESRIALIEIPNKDEAFLRERILTMYANPAKNQTAALA